MDTTPKTPVRTAPAASMDAAKGAATDAWTDALRFYRTGRRPSEGRTLAETPGLLPAHLFPYRDLSRLRGAYPVVLAEDATRTLTAVFDALAGVLADVLEVEGDDRARLEHVLRRMEARVREQSASGEAEPLGVRWDAAAHAVTEREGASVREALAALRRELPAEALVVPCGAEAVEHLFEAAARRNAQTRAGELAAEVEALTDRLRDVLAADASQAPEAHDPQHLAAAIGGNGHAEIDAEALARLLGRAPLANPLPDERRERLAVVLETLERLGPWMLGRTETAPCRDVVEAMERVDDHRDRLLAFMRAFHVATLELENRYRPERHDAAFEAYTWGDLSAAEQALCPPVHVHLRDAALDADDRVLLADLLERAVPVRVLLLADRHADAEERSGEAACRPARAGRLALAAVMTHQPYVLQAPASDLSELLRGFAAACAFDGPALCTVYVGAPDDAPDVPAYLRAALARDSRAVPLFTYDPARGTTWSDRFDVSANPDPERTWPAAPLTLADGEEPVELPFTYADALACDARFARHFLLLAPEDDGLGGRGDERLVPLHTFLEEASTGTPSADADQLPYVLLREDSGAVHRAVPSRAVVAATRRAAEAWHRLRELGGVANSHVAAQLEAERTRLEAERDEALAELERRHQEALDQATGALAEEIVSNIAAGLLELPATGGALPKAAPRAKTPAAPAPKAPEPEAEAEAAEAEAVEPEEDDEPLSFDEAYVETPRCTTCNECTNLNGLVFAYNEEQQAYIKDASAGTYRDLVLAAERCPVAIIHPGKPLDPDEAGLDELLERAKPFL